MSDGAKTREAPPPEGRRRVVIEDVRPQVDGGRSAVKRVLGDRLVVEADLIADGHDAQAGLLLARPEGEASWRETPLVPVGNDRWRGVMALDRLGFWEYTIEGWIDAFGIWRHGLERKVAAGQDVSVELADGAPWLAAAAARATGPEARTLAEAARRLTSTAPLQERIAVATDPALAMVAARHPDRALSTRWDPPLTVMVDPLLARFSSWYEMFPRSAGAPGRHGSFRDALARLPYVAGMGFDVLYLPPIHPIGRGHRKGRNNSLQAGPDDPGSPWAIGAPEGGHKAIHPELGTPEDFRAFIARARDLGLEVALDIAFQASPDHPYLAEHPDWFVQRGDGSIQYAENPPKRYQDIYPFAFTGAAWESLWLELRDVFSHWIAEGVRVFRVDNPHTKPLPFWRWCIGTLKRRHPELIFLAEAFTRPKLMYALAKAGFSQSYTYFTWRTTKAELTHYLEVLTRTEVAEYFRPNFWPNTPDILPEHLQLGGPSTFIARLVLAGTLSSNYGIYGPAFELHEHRPRPDAEEYLDNEKYQIRAWDIERSDSLRPVIKRLNQIRRDTPALQANTQLCFHPTDNELVIAYSKQSEDGESAVLVVVNLDARHRHSAWLTLDLAALGVAGDETFQVHDQLGDTRYLWRGARNFVELDPAVMPAHVFRVLRRTRTEKSFEYYL